MHRITVTHHSQRSLPDLFATLSDHNRLGQVLGAPVKRIRDGQSEVNGVGSVRKIGVGPLGVEETVTAVTPNESIEYRITRGGFPIRNHLGRLNFAANGAGSSVEWTIEFDSALPLVGGVARGALEKLIGMGLRRLG